MRLSIIIALLLTFSSVYAAGRTSFPLLRDSSDPRVLALGNAVTTLTGSTHGSSINPAALSSCGRQAAVSYSSHFLDFWNGNISLAFPANERIYTGLNIKSFSFGEFDYAGVDAVSNETFSSQESVVSGVISSNWQEKLHAGVGLKFAWGTLEEETSSAIALDLGLIWNTGYENLILSGVLRNFGKQTQSYGNDESRLPTELILGGSRQLDHLPLTLHFSAVFGRDEEESWEVEMLPGDPWVSFNAGGEFKIEDKLPNPFFVRVGYQSKGKDLQVGHRLDSVAGFSFGFGLLTNNYGIDYAFAPMGVLGDIHSFGLTGRF